MNDFLYFRTMIAPVLMAFLCTLGMMLLTVGGLAMLYEKKWREGLAALAFIVVWRLLCEVMVVLFRIHESLNSLDKSVGDWRKEWLKR